MHRWVFAILATLFYAAAIIEGLFTPLRLDLPLSQVENVFLLAVGAAFMIAFFLANEPAADVQPPSEPTPSEPARPSGRRRTWRRE